MAFDSVAAVDPADIEIDRDIQQAAEQREHKKDTGYFQPDVTRESVFMLHLLACLVSSCVTFYKIKGNCYDDNHLNVNAVFWNGSRHTFVIG